MDVSKQLVIKHCFFTKLELGAGKYSYKKDFFLQVVVDSTGSFYVFWLDIALNFYRFFVYFCLLKMKLEFR